MNVVWLRSDTAGGHLLGGVRPIRLREPRHVYLLDCVLSLLRGVQLLGMAQRNSTSECRFEFICKFYSVIVSDTLKQKLYECSLY